MRWVVIAAAMLAGPAYADDATRAAVFDVDRALKACGGRSASMVEISYCLENVHEQARRTAAFYLKKARVHYEAEAKRPEETGYVRGEPARKAAADVAAMAKAYETLIEADCRLAGLTMYGGSGQGQAIQSCEITHLSHQIARLRSVVGR